LDNRFGFSLWFLSKNNHTIYKDISKEKRKFCLQTGRRYAAQEYNE